MNILHLNTYTHDYNLSFPHFQFHKELLAIGEKSVILSAKGNIKDDNIILLNKGGVLPFFGLSRLARKLFFGFNKSRDQWYFYPEWNLDFITFNLLNRKIPFTPDIILVYWSKFAFNQRILFQLHEHYNAPILIIPMDMAPLTGGCHYAFDCSNYIKECGNCPAIGSARKNDISLKNHKVKRRFINKTNIKLLAVTTTLFNQAKQSSLFKDKPIYKLLLSVNENIFKPIEKDIARNKLNLPFDKKIIFFGAASITVKRKGFSYLLAALNFLKKLEKQNYTNDDVFLLIAGKIDNEVKIPFNSKFVGYLKTQDELALAYQACDVFANPSIEDSGPLMVNQAIMSGRPVVAFNMGVVPDLVFTGETGYVAKLKDSEDFGNGLNYILSLDDQQWSTISENCCRIGLEKCSSAKHPEHLLNILNDCLKET